MANRTKPRSEGKPEDNGQPVPGDAYEPDDTPDTGFEPHALEAQPPAPAEAKAEPAFDLFDPNTYKVPQSLAAAAGVEKHLVELPVTTPQGSWWVRRHPDEQYCRKAWFIILKDERETYLVSPALWQQLAGESTFKPLALYLSVTMQGKLFLWSVKVQADDTKEPAKWMRPPLEAVKLAKDKWTRIYWNEDKRQHEITTVNSDVEPEWPDLPMRDLMELAFKGFTIEKMDHPVIRRLRGKAR
jgi:hypothetical protein